jgi:hypothetical protein
MLSKLVHLKRKVIFRLRNDSPKEFVKRTVKTIYWNTLRKGILLLVKIYVRKNSTYHEELRENLDSKSYWKVNKNTEPSTDPEEIFQEVKGVKLHNEEYTFDDFYLAEVENCYIYGENSTTFKESNILADTSSWQNGRVEKQLMKDIERSPIEILKLILSNQEKDPEQVVQRAIVLNSKWDNYYHWLLEHIPKLRALEKYEEETGNTATVIIPENPPSFIKESLEVFAPDKEIIEADNETIRAEKLILPSFPQHDLETLQWIREKGLEQKEEPENTYSRIYVSRQNTDTRKVSNFKEIKEILEEHDIKVVEMEEYTLQEQIGLIHNAELIIGPHGAGLSNMIWGEDLKIIEIFNKHIKPLYKILAAIENNNYNFIIGISTNTATKERNRDIYLDPSNLKKALEDS